MCGVTPSGSSTFAAGFSRPRNVPLSSREFHVPSFKSYSDEVLFLTGPTHRRPTSHPSPTYSYWRRDRSTQKRLLLSFVLSPDNPRRSELVAAETPKRYPPPPPLPPLATDARLDIFWRRACPAHDVGIEHGFASCLVLLYPRYSSLQSYSRIICCTLLLYLVFSKRHSPVVTFPTPASSIENRQLHRLFSVGIWCYVQQ